MVRLLLFGALGFVFRGIHAIHRRYNMRDIRRVGSSSNISHDVHVKNPYNLSIGEGCHIGRSVTIGCMSPVDIENNVTVSEGVIIETGSLKLEPRRHVSKPITLREGCWVGARAIILGGVTVGRGAIIAAGEVVRRNVSDNEVYRTK